MRVKLDFALKISPLYLSYNLQILGFQTPSGFPIFQISLMTGFLVQSKVEIQLQSIVLICKMSQLCLAQS